MKPTIRAIETEFLGERFRSRLEAKWARVFHALNIPFTFEPEGFELEEDGQVSRYLPDFWLSTFGAWVEIKPESPSERERKLARLLHQGHGAPVLVVCGVPGKHFIQAYVNGASHGELGFLFECQFCHVIEVFYLVAPYSDDEWMSVSHLCQCGNASPLSTPRLHRAYAEATGCRFERLPKNMRRALGAV